MASVASYNPTPIGGVDDLGHAHSHMDDYGMGDGDTGPASPGASSARGRSHRDDEDSHAGSGASVSDDDEIDARMHEESDALSFATADNEGSGAEFKTHDFDADDDDDDDEEEGVDEGDEDDAAEEEEEQEQEEEGDDRSSPRSQETGEPHGDEDVSETSSDVRRHCHRHHEESSTAVPNMSSYSSSLNSNSSANLFYQPCDNNNYVSSSNDKGNRDSHNKSSTSLIDQESFYSHISSPQARYEANKQAFESRFSSENSVLSNYSTASKKSSKSVRRKDVITPLADFGDWNSNDNKDNNNNNNNNGKTDVLRPVPVAPANPERAMVLHSSNHHDHNATSPAPPTHQWTLPEPSPPSHSRALVVHSPSKPSSRPRGLEPDEAACRGRSGRDPPGEAPDERPFIGAPRVVRRSGDASVGSHASGNSRTGPWNARSVQWVDPKTVANEGDIDFGVLRHYERLVGDGGGGGGGVDGNDDSREYRGMDADGASSPPLHSRSGLLTPKRIRIATISSGYKKANFFVREDLDQRIYFHDLEDAINYMAKRGYARMRKEEELEWMKLLGKAHGVVKVGPTKKKQRYRKGKLVLILSKPITDDYPFRTTSKKRQPSSPHTHVTTLALVARQHTPSDESTAASSHTSIGRSIRGPYKSYSEKFLAEQEEEKRLLLGQPPPRLMMLMNGPVDPEPQQELLQLTNGSGDEDEDEAISEGDEESSSKMSASKKSSNASEARMVNYRGGVMYFTPHQYEESDDDDDEETEGEEGDSHQEDDDDDDTEDESAKHDDEEEEEETTVNSEEESAHSGMESRHSNADSSTNSEMSSIARNSGVKIVPGGNGKSTLNSNRAPTPYDKVAMRRNRQSSPPEMEPISDDSEDSSLVSGEA